MKLVNKTRLINHFVDLARIASPSGQEQEISKILTNQLHSLNLGVIKDSYGNLIAKLPGVGETIILCAHMDTVAIGKGEKISPIINQDRITSDGTTILGADNKDAIAAIIEALTVVKENNLPHKSVEVVFTRQEEAISEGAKNLDFAKLSGKECIISDAANEYGTIIISAPYCFKFDVEVQGKRAHAKEPERGINAALIMAKAILAMQLGRIDELTTSNIAYLLSGLNGVINSPHSLITNIGQENRNTIPDLAIVMGEVRGAKIKNVTQTLEQIRDTFDKVTQSAGGKTLWRSEKLADGYYFGKNDPLVELTEKIFRSQNITPAYLHSTGGSDANILNGRGIKTVVISSAHRDNHKVTEYLIIDDLIKLTDFFTKIITTTI